MKQHDANAKIIVDYLKNEPLVTDVLYPGKGGMLSFRLQESEWVGSISCKILQLITFAESLGGVESFITYPATQTHADIPREERITTRRLRPTFTFLCRCGGSRRFDCRFEASICNFKK